MDIRCTGPMPTSEFIAHFLAEPHSSRPSSTQFKVDKPCEGKQTVFVDVGQLCSHLHFSTSPDGLHRNATDHHHPCSRIYAKYGPEASSSSSPPLNSQFFELLIEYAQTDPFRHSDSDQVTNRPRSRFQRTSPRAERTLRDHYMAVSQIFSSQPIVSFFSILITDEGARLLRWDRAGVVVTERFDHQASDNPLTEFLWRFDSMSSEQRGHDVSFSYPTLDEITTARAAFARSIHISISPDSPLYKVTVLDDVSREEFFYVVSKPQFSNDRLFGYATRGYVAVDLRDGSLVWLKDVWRVDNPPFFKEGDVYRKLREKNVPHVAPLCCAGDVPSQATRTQDFANPPWVYVRTAPTGRRHHRLVLGVVGRPLNNFKNTRELCTSIRDAVDAHGKAYTELNILHGDISAGNILITDDGHGLLIDWDLAFDVKIGRQGAAMGTWQFISSRLMGDPKEADHLLCDDLESFVHVLLYHLVHHRPTGIIDLPGEIEDLYNRGMKDDAPQGVCCQKRIFFGGWALREHHLRGYICRPCVDLVEQLRRLFFRAIYASKTDVTARQRNEALKDLQTPNHVLQFFDKALKKRSWPKNDGSVDAVKAFWGRVTPDYLHEDETVATGKRTLSDAFGDDSQSETSTPAKRRWCPSPQKFPSGFFHKGTTNARQACSLL